jgi:flagellar biosynthesis protein FliR
VISLIEMGSGDIMAWLGRLWWPFVRIAALLWSLPVFDSPAVTPRARILLALFLSLLVAPGLTSVPAVDPFSVTAALMTLEQILFGIIMGVSIRILFEVMAMMGLVLSMQMGLSMAMMMDPGSGDSVSLLGQLFWLMAAILFFALNGHIVVLAVLVESFELWQIGSGIYEIDIISIVGLFGWMFSAALLIALPGVVSMMLVNLTFGVATRSAPSLNLFVLGFPMALLLGFATVFFTLISTGIQFADLAWHVLTVMRSAMGA